MAKKAINLREKVADILELPKDVVMDAPRATLMGNIQVTIENHRGIIEYDSGMVKINTSIGVFKIMGSDLIIKKISTDEIILSGIIDNIDIMS